MLKKHKIARRLRNIQVTMCGIGIILAMKLAYDLTSQLISCN